MKRFMGETNNRWLRRPRQKDHRDQRPGGTTPHYPHSRTGATTISSMATMIPCRRRFRMRCN
jgi:hypothetical protein